jgi:hypothetical protein
VIFSPDFDLTHSLLMKRPVGWTYLRPFGAVNSIDRSDILNLEFEKVLVEDLRRNKLSFSGFKNTSENRNLEGVKQLINEKFGGRGAGESSVNPHP